MLVMLHACMGCWSDVTDVCLCLLHVCSHTQDEPENLNLSPEDLEKRLQSLLDTCTYTVFNYTRRGLFDRDKLIVLTLLTFTILLRSQVRTTHTHTYTHTKPHTAPPRSAMQNTACYRGAGGLL